MPLPFDGTAQWIWSAEGNHDRPKRIPPGPYDVRRFRCGFDAGQAAARRLAVHVSADSRYVLFMNGALVGRGPAKGDIDHHFYDSYDLSSRLRDGENVLAAIVLDYSRVASQPGVLGAPTSVMTYCGAFCLQGAVLDDEGNVVAELSTPGTWRAHADEAYAFQNEGNVFGGFVGYFERYRAAHEPAGWLRPGFDDSQWQKPAALGAAIRRDAMRDTATRWGLVPRMIPALEESDVMCFEDAFVPGGAAAGAPVRRLISGEGALRVAPNSQCRFIADAGRLTTGYPELSLRGGAGAEVRLVYAEALRIRRDVTGAEALGESADLSKVAAGYYDEQEAWSFDRRGDVIGWRDIVEPAGGELTYRPLHWRTFRYVEAQIETQDEPLEIDGMGHRFSAYPYDIQAEYASSDAHHAGMLDISLRTFRLCSHETFEDCPYYEQMQYAGDSAITSLIGMALTGDARLTRQALYLFDWSRLPEGITQSRYPSRIPQVIPSWSLHWISMIHDYLLYTGERDTPRDLLKGVHAVLDWFRERSDRTGLPAALPYWNTTDWCPQWDRGQPPGWDEGPTCVISSQFARALAETAWLHGRLGNTGEAAALRAEARDAARAIHRVFWSEREGLYYDRPGGPELSQYGNAWAVYAGAADEAAAQRVATRFPFDAALAPASFFGTYYVIQAMKTLGSYDRFQELLGPWRYMAQSGLTTWAEETTYWRSMCHAWSAHPALEFVRGILGVAPTAPGFERAEVAPWVCGLSWAKGRAPTPHGPIEVSWRVAGGAMRLELQTPVPTKVIAPDGSRRDCEPGSIEVELPLPSS